jgi:hypothetical protein
MEDHIATNLCGDGRFGPVVATESCRGGFDFTVLFESTILAVIPSVCFLLLAPLRFFQLSKESPKVRSSFPRMATLVSSRSLKFTPFKAKRMTERGYFVVTIGAVCISSDSSSCGGQNTTHRRACFACR